MLHRLSAAWIFNINYIYSLPENTPLQKKIPNYMYQYFPYKDNRKVVELLHTRNNILHYKFINITAMISNLQMCTWITLPNCDRNHHYKTSHTHLRKRSIFWANTLLPLLELMPLEVVGLWQRKTERFPTVPVVWTPHHRNLYINLLHVLSF